jgi:protocatechuate 3,4-dioxygenase beta subunit
MATERLYSRRLIIGGGLCLAAGLAGGARGQQLVATSGQDLGPFYPVLRPLDQDADLTRVQGSSGVARGTVINVVGRVVDPGGRPVQGARLDLWQANSAGRYTHPLDGNNQAPLDPNFQGSAVVQTGADGTFRFRTVKPGAYRIPDGRTRTPHIHVDITGRSDRITTQMYFAGEALNESDFLLQTAAPRESVIASAIDPLADDPGHPAFRWEVVLAVG